MSFITKRERVFKEYELFDLPSRNEGKLKAYASCTDARAWSHFCSDKTEHLVDIIKRNNERCRPKYIPTDVIVDTLMVAKNNEISRLKRKIEEFEQMLAAYDQLELSCEQKCEIANAHAAIKAANKELDDMFLDLDLSGFTEIDSEAFETGKSRGDEPSKYRADEWTYERDTKENRPKTDNKSNQTAVGCLCEASTNATDPRIEEMKNTIITKDAKLSAMQNTIAVMENDVCEPYCIYAHIYTALEKIFGILCQNEKYKQYLDLLTTGKDIRSIDLKGKILFKLKILEKFSLALIAPCSQNHDSAPDDCTCYKTQVVARLETTYALSSQSKLSNHDNKRAQLIADIMENDEMKEILSRESANLDENVLERNDFDEDSCSIDGENLKRLKNLQENYNDLLECYENLKHERNCVQLKCQKYDELGREVETLRAQIREYNALWSEKEYFRKRSVDLDDLKEHYLVLTNETTNLETKLKTEIEINKIKTETLEELRKNNIALEKKLSEIEIAFETDRNALECKLKETECKVMCQDQQIKSLNVQIDKLIEQEDYSNTLNSDKNALSLLNEIESLKEEVLNLKEALCYGEEERQNSLKDFQDKIALINELKIEIEDWKNKCEKALQRNDELENVTDNYEVELQRLTEENKSLLLDIEERTAAVENLINIINNKSTEIDHLMSEIDHKNIINNNLNTQIESQASTIEILESEKTRTLSSLELAKSESQELIDRTKDYNNLLNQNNELSKNLSNQIKECNILKEQCTTLTCDNEKLKLELNEIQTLQELNNSFVNEIARLKGERDHYKTQSISSFELAKSESLELIHRTKDYENLLQQNNELSKNLSNQIKEYNILKEKCATLTSECEKLKLEGNDKKGCFNTRSISSLEIPKTVNQELIDQTNDYKKMLQESIEYPNSFSNQIEECNILKEPCTTLTLENEKVKFEQNEIQRLRELKNAYINEILELQKERDQSKIRSISSGELIESDSQELIDRTEDNNNLLLQNKELSKNLSDQMKEYNVLKDRFEIILLDNEKLKVELNEIQRLQELNNAYGNEIVELKNERDYYKTSFILTKKESEVLNEKLEEFENVRQYFEKGGFYEFKSISKNDEEDYIMHNNVKSYNDTIELIQSSSKEDDNRKEKLIEPKKLKEDLSKYHEAYQNLKNENLNLKLFITSLRKEKEMIMNQVNSLKHENEKFLQRESLISELEEELNCINKTHKSLMDEKTKFESYLANKHEEISNLDNQLTNKDMEIQNLHQQLKKMNHELVTTKDDLNVNKCENNELQNERHRLTETIRKYDIEINRMNKELDVLKLEKNNIEKEYENQLRELSTAKKEIRDLTHQSQSLISLNDDLENALITERSQDRLKSEFLEKSYEDIVREFTDLKQQKIETQNKIRDLMDKLEESENIISKLTEDVMARDDKIVILENHINELEEEIRKLQTCVADAIDAGEQITDVQAHHSKATHDIKMELDKFKNENALFDQKLSNTKPKFSNSFKDRNDLISKIDRLQNDHEIIVTDIKQIELQFIGDSELSPEKCDAVHVLHSLQRVRNYLETSSAKSTDLEQTLLKVQSSSQLLLSKADEGKRLVELEKQKIITEKEEAISQRRDLEKKLLNLKEKLEKQICSDENIITDLEQEILNKDLIIDKINSSTEKYVTKLKNDINSLQGLYDNATKDLMSLHQQLQNLTDENSVYCQEIVNNKKELQEKTKEILDLHNAIKDIQNKSNQLTTDTNLKLQEKCEEVANLQKTIDINKITIYTPVGINTSTIDLLVPDDGVKIKHDKTLQVDEHVNNAFKERSINSDLGRLFYEHSKQKLQALKAIQVTNISVEPKFDGRNYSNLISEKSVDQSYSIKTYDEVDDTSKENDIFKSDTNSESKPLNLRNDSQSQNVIDSTNNKGFEVKTSDKRSNKSESKLPKSEQSADMFVVYQDSDTDTHSMEKTKESTSWPIHHRSEVVETLMIHSKMLNKTNQDFKKDDSGSISKDNNNMIFKQGIEITMPRVELLNSTHTLSPKTGESSFDSFSAPTTNSSSENIKKPHKKIENINNNEAKVYSIFDSIFQESENQQINNENKDSDSLLYKSNALYDNLKNEISRETSEFHNDPLDLNRELQRVESKPKKTVQNVAKTKAQFVTSKPKNALQKDMRKKVALSYVLDTIELDRNLKISNDKKLYSTRKTQSDSTVSFSTLNLDEEKSVSDILNTVSSLNEFKTEMSNTTSEKQLPTLKNRGVLVKIGSNENYKQELELLKKLLKIADDDYKKKIEALKLQYDNNIKSIIREHNDGVKNLQSLHEETLQDIIKGHENEVENLRTLSIEAMRKAEKLERENSLMKSKQLDSSTYIDDDHVLSLESISQRGIRKVLTKTNIEALNVKPKTHGPCTCSLDINVSDTIRNIFQQVDNAQRKLDERTYFNYILNKILTDSVKSLDAQELSYLHLKICRTWKQKLNKEEAFQKKISSLESELINKQKHAQQHIADLDRKVAEERRALQEIREAVFRTNPRSRSASPRMDHIKVNTPETTTNLDCKCKLRSGIIDKHERKAAGDIPVALLNVKSRPRRSRIENNRAVFANLNVEESRKNNLYHDERPTRLRKTDDKQKHHKK